MKPENRGKWFLAGLLALLAVFGATGAYAFTVTVESCDASNVCGGLVDGFYWLVEEDTTHPVTPGVSSSESLGVSIHKSYAPVVAKGTQAAGSSANIAVPATTRYAVSILPTSGNYTMGGANVAVNQSNVTIRVHELPIPTAQASILVFEDIAPINNAPNIPAESGLEGFSLIIYDAGGLLSQDAFGNPLGTTYDALGNVLTVGDGTIKTDANGEAMIKYIPPGKYGIQAIPPTGTNWVQNSTIEGTAGIDVWIKANEANRVFEFGPGLYHVFIGFVQPMDLLSTLPNPGGNSSTVSGEVVTIHTSRPPDFTQNLGYPVPECWIGLNTLEAGAANGVYVASCNPDSTFSINGVPPGTYQLVMWDKPLDYIFGFTTVIVPDDGSPVDLGQIGMNAWFGTFEGYVFFDANQNGYIDPGEQGIPEQNINLRFRDGTIYAAQPTGPEGDYSLVEVFPFFKFLVAEVDFARFKATGATIVVDEGGPLAPGMKNTPQLQPDNGNLPYRTELGPVLTQAMTTYADQTNNIYWGKNEYGPGENGGISGIVFYATTRAENDPRFGAAEPWEPGIPRVQVNLYQDANMDGIIDDIDGNPGIQLADVDNYPFGNFPGTEDIDRNYAGQTPGVFDNGDAVDIGTTDSWDDNLPTGCVGPQQFANGVPIIDCAETLQTWNQIRPAVFDGGYAFGPDLPIGGYIVETVTPPGYELLKEEDKNVDFGDSYRVSPLLLPPVCVGTTANLQPLHTVPAELSLFPGVATYNAGAVTPLCNMKQVTVSEARNTAADFFLFTEAPKAARGVGLINNDLGITLNPNNPVFGEKDPASWIPVSVQDFAGNEVIRAYSDEYGAYNFLVPSTYTVNIPTPSGVSPNMLRVCLNHPGPILDTDPGSPTFGQMIADPRFDARFSQTCYTLDFWPGKTTYLDTPVIPVAAFAAAASRLDCQTEDGTPLISDVTDTGGNGPYASVANDTITINIMSPGMVDVPNPDCLLFDTTCTTTIARDYGFGATQGSGSVTVGGVPLTITAWSNTVISGTVPAGMSTGQLVVTRDNGKSSLDGITLTVGGPAPTVITSGQSIQLAIDTAASGELIIVRPGEYNENLIMWKDVKLQGSGAYSTVINAAVTLPESMQLWRSKLNGLITTADISLIPGQNPDLHLEVAGITVVANDGVFTPGDPARIDGFTITSATQGGGITVNGYAHNLQISNNRIINNAGVYGGGIRVGTPGLLDASCVDGSSNPTYCSSANDNISIHNNLVTQNGAVGGVNGGGGITLFTGSDSYMVSNNLVCGNFTGNDGGGIAHIGLSDNGVIANNTIIFNESSYGTTTGGNAGGVLIAGEAPPIGATGGVTPGAGNVTLNANLIQGNLAGSGNGGGVVTSAVNGQDVLPAPTDDTNWYSVNILNNMIVKNVAGFMAGGIFLADTTKAFIINNTVAHNDSLATGANAFGAGLNISTPQAAGIVANAHSAGLVGIAGFAQTYSNPVIEDSIVWANRSFYFDLTLNGGIGGLVPNPAIPYWDLQVLTVPALFAPSNSILTDVTGYPGNLSANPLFVAGDFNTIQTAIAPQEGGNLVSPTIVPLKVTGDFHIRTNSPAVNFGAGTYLGMFAELASDIDGDVRPNGASPDAGADEQNPSYVPPLTFVDKIGIVRGYTWYLDLNGSGMWENAPVDIVFEFGIPGDIPITGDWNGDGFTEIGIVRGYTWYLDFNGNRTWDPGTDLVFEFGIPGDTPITGDWNGDGSTEIGIVRGYTWYLDFNGNRTWDPGTDFVFEFGISGDIPITGDWDGSGATKVGVVRGDTWYLDFNGNRTWDPGIDSAFVFGVNGTPVTGNWNSDNRTEIGVFNGGIWYLDLNGNYSYEDCSAVQGCASFGIPGDTPVTGNW